MYSPIYMLSRDLIQLKSLLKYYLRHVNGASCNKFLNYYAIIAIKKIITTLRSVKFYGSNFGRNIQEFSIF